MFQLLLLPLLFAPNNGDPAETTLDPASLAALQDTTAPAWSGSVTAGMVYTEGNADTFAASLFADAVRDAARDRWSYNLYGNYGEQGNTVGGVEVTQKSVADYGGSAQYDYKANEKLYYYGNATFRADDIANLDLRYILGAGAGYTLHDDEERHWLGEGGLSFISETLQTGVSAAETSESLAIRLASNYDWNVSETTKFIQKTELYPNLTESDDYLARFDQRLNVTITGAWSLNLQYILNYDGMPAPGATKADHRVVVGLGWSFGE